eukprot:Rmarinus@m.27538
MFAINMNPNDRFRVIPWRALCLTSTPNVRNREHEDANVRAGEPLLLVPVVDYCITEGAETPGGQLEACNANSSIYIFCATASWKYLFSVFKLKRHCKIDGEVAA